MNKTLKILTVLLLAIMLITFTTNVFAATGTAIKPGDLDAKIDFGTSDDTGSLMAKAGKIMGMIRNISAIAAVIIIMILGVQYMLGSVEQKAEYKKSFMPLIIGIVLVVGATSVASFIFGIVE